MISDHTSDCALNNAPASAPEPCSCGVSPQFKRHTYDITYDLFRWKLYSRETLVAESTGVALASLYGGDPKVGRGVLIGRAVLCGFQPIEQGAVDIGWVDLWREPYTGYLERHGICDLVSAPDGSPLDPTFRASLAVQATDEEVRDVMAPWIEYWGSRPDYAQWRGGQA